MLLVNVCLIDSDWARWRESLAGSLRNFHARFGREVKFYFVLQTKDGVRIDPGALGVPADQVEICSTERFSVSAARNRGISYAKAHGFDSIVFHDASLVFLPAACAFMRDHHRRGLLRCGYAFDDPAAHVRGDGSRYETRMARINRRTTQYVWTYCFPVATLTARFDERFGPGEDTLYNCGEDALFLRAYLAATPARRVLELASVGVVHPPRPRDYSKHLDYAYGQGKLYQLKLRSDPGPAMLMYAAAFFGNALLRALLLRRNAFQILRARIAGFLDTHSPPRSR
jgi:hypothetical protein